MIFYSNISGELIIDEDGSDSIHKNSFEDESVQSVHELKVNFDQNIHTDNNNHTLFSQSKEKVNEIEETKIVHQKQPINSDLWKKEPLPEDWKQVYHSSGLILYIHKLTNVVTLSRPYLYDKKRMGALRFHKLPLASFPCMEVTKTKELLSNNKCTAKDFQSEADSSIVHCPSKKLKLSDDCSTEENSLINSEDIQYIENNYLDVYLSKKFDYETVKVSLPHWKNMRLKEKEANQRKRFEDLDMRYGDHGIGFVPDGEVKVVVKPHNQNKNIIQIIAKFGKNLKQAKKNNTCKVIQFNVSIKTGVCMLNEYCQTVLQCKPTYECNNEANDKDTRNQFHCTCSIGDKDYAIAIAEKKRDSRNSAALKTLDMLVPGFLEHYQNALTPESNDYQKELSIKDDSIWKNWDTFGEYNPHKLLIECCNRDKGISNNQYEFEHKVTEKNTISYTIKYGAYCANGEVRNKKIARQQGAHKLLVLMHPQVKTWGEIMEKYGTSVTKKKNEFAAFNKEIFELKQKERQMKSKDSYTQLQKKEEVQLNPSGVLEKLKEEMHKMRRKKAEKDKKEFEKLSAMPNRKDYYMCNRCKAAINALDDDKFNPNEKSMLLIGMKL